MKIYVGTYAKYNNGSLKGAWLNLTDYSDKQEFIDACLELHDDEEDPELMFQDIEGVPSFFATESSVSEKLWELLELDDNEQEMVLVAIDHGLINVDDDYSNVSYNFIVYNNWDELFNNWLEINSVPENLVSYIDRDQVIMEMECNWSIYEGNNKLYEWKN